jgi:hypothetical protein
MERKVSVSSHFKASCSMSQTSPVKMFDKQEEDSSKRKDSRNRTKSEKSGLTIIKLESVIEKQQKEIGDLKKVIVTKDCDYAILLSSLECALKLLMDFKDDKIVKTELEQFIKVHGSKKRNSEESDNDETKSKKIKLGDSDKLASFDVEEPQVMRKRKIESEIEVLPKLSPIKKSSFEFLEEVKISALKSKSKKASVKSNTIEEEIEPVAKSKESISSVFDFDDDPDVLEIQARKKREAEELAARTKVKSKGRNRESMARMAEFSQSVTGSQSLDKVSEESSSDESGPKLKIPKLKKQRKKNSKRKKINSFLNKNGKEKENSKDELEETHDFTPSIDELLKLPDRPEDGGKTMDEVLDDLDIEIAQRKKKHEEEMAQIDTDIAAEKERQEERRARMKKNTLLRDRLEVEVTELEIRRMFEENKEYLKSIEAGRVYSSRHKAFHKSSRTRHALYYTMITDPFTDNQLEWTLEEMGKVWMKTRREQMDNNEYVWKVLLAECFIKFYMDQFGFDKNESEKRISETPLRKAVEDNSSDDEL